MGKHSKSDDRPVLTPPTPQERADSFDRQHAASTASADSKRESGTYPYHLDSQFKK